MTHTSLRVRDTHIPGPAHGREVSSPNRVGSAAVPVRIYEPADPWGTLVWAHGGSFVRGTLDWPEADWAARRFAHLGLRVYSVDYVLASDTVKAPAPSNDVAAVLREVLATHAGPVLIGGASAGGHLATRAALDVAEDAGRAASGAPMPAALLLVYPTLHRKQRVNRKLSGATSRLPEQRRFGKPRIAEMYHFYLGEQGGLAAEDRVLPVGELSASQLAPLPPTFIVNADADDLRASAEQFAEQLAEAGVTVQQRVQPGTVHGYLNRPDETEQSVVDARRTISHLVGEVRALLAHSATPVAEPQLRRGVSLTLPSGKLNPKAVGWAPQPIVDTSGFATGRGRNKRWEYWNVCTPTHILALTVSHIDYAAVHEVWAYEIASGKTWGRSVTAILGPGTVLTPRIEHGRSMARAKNLAIDIDEVPGGTRLRAQIAGVSFDVMAGLPEGHERLAVVVPWSETRFQYTVKDVARPATGWVRIDGERIELPEGESWAVLDHGRGRWPYNITWNWGAGSGRSSGHVIGIQVGAKWTAGTGVSENAFFVNGRMHKIHGETTWAYDLDDWQAPWRVAGGGLDAVFTPFHNKVTRTNLVVLQNHTDQCFGHWSGSFTTREGERIEFDGIMGWAEHVHNRW